MRHLRQFLKLSNLVPLLAIIVGFATSTGLTDKWYPPDKIMIALIAIVAMELLIQRVETLDTLNQVIRQPQGIGSTITLLSRTDKSFEHFQDFVKGSSEVMVIGIDLAFMAKASAWFVKESIQAGMDLKLIIIDTNTDGQMKDSINDHDERNVPSCLGHDHVQSARDVIETLKTFVTDSSKGKLEIRSRVGIPSPSLTLVDPTKPQGKMRIELKLYKRNQGSVPYFILTRNSYWYPMFFEHYYIKLWEDSKPIYQSHRSVV